MRKNQNFPKYLRKSEIVLLFLRTFLVEGFRNPIIKKAYSLKNILGFLKIRKKLLLTKIIKFNGSYYSTLSLPAFPSEAYNNMVKNGGLNFMHAGSKLKNQIDTVLLAITSECKLNCNYCYEKQNLNSSNNISSQTWIKIVNELQSRGTSIIILTGGEPLLAFEKLVEILNSGDKKLSDFHIHTSGWSITKEKVNLLKEAGLTAAGIGLDDYRPEIHDKIRGKNSFAEAVKALKLFNEAGIFTYVNFMPGREILSMDHLLKYLDFLKQLNVNLVELLEPRPCGGIINSDIKDFFNQNDKKLLYDFTLLANTKRKYKDHPLIYYLAHIEGKDQMGCMMGGLSHFYIDGKGNVNPCVFMPVSFGNILEEDVSDIHNKMRSVIKKPIHSECPSLLLSEAIKEKAASTEVPIPFNSISKEWQNIISN